MKFFRILKISCTSFLFFALLACGKQGENKDLTYAQVVSKLTDLKSLAELPETGEKSEMWSSYDRKSKIDSAGNFVDWDANIDGLEPQFIRKEGENEVLAEMEGPGAIVRIWSASPRDGKVKIYIDGKEEPVVNLPFIDYFKPSIAAFEYPELVYETNARGFNNYISITYQKSCKIVAEPGWGQYYHFNYISFPEGTQVESFNPDLNENNKSALEEVNQFFRDKMGNSPHDFETTKLQVEEKIGKSQEKVLVSLKNSGAISSLKARMKIKDSSKAEEMLRKVVLKMKWDGEEKPTVWSPLGDFFGTSPGYNKYKTLPMGMTDDWMYSYWYMPFAEGAEIIIQNDFEEAIEIAMEINYEELKDVENLGRFHAKWHRDLEPLSEDRWPDWTLLETEGRGRFLGTHLLVWNPKGGSCSLAGPGHHWWGEGDEKFFIDGETFPSTFGTGTEDYFGYAWCDPSEFEHAYHSQTQDNDNMGYQPMNRWHIIENIPFQKSFDGYMEKYFPNHWPTQYSAVVYWYLEPGGTDPLGKVAVEDRYGYEIEYDVFRVDQAVEGETLEIKENTGGWASTDVFADEKIYETVSGHKVLNWNAEPKDGNQLVLTFEWPEDGKYLLEANFVKSQNGGKFRMFLNDRELETINFKTEEEHMVAEKQQLGVIEINPGVQTLKLSSLMNEGEPNNFKLDYLRFIKQ
ncbi:DUF2961 domain-containing protein [Gramella lutea]|uniref:DUF2961 domain-containing protein n=1 Tax=Christiangramia lutea TaxID=1607951 RepID=A0A9X1V091_9FLAO|nr:DUF2961 domain-containing protein [Christiangramia lutea]MCH4821775.1 DUF2961 domain-containing protein [Christiangramia lutea]